MPDLRRRLERLERGLGAGEGAPVMHVVEAPDGEGLGERARAALAAAGVTRGRADEMVVIRRFGDPGAPARLVASHLRTPPSTQDHIFNDLICRPRDPRPSPNQISREAV